MIGSEMAVTSPARPRPSSGFLGRAATVLATGLGAGHAPVAPGTAGTAVGLALFWPILALPRTWQLGVLVVVFLLGVAASSHVARASGSSDPGIVVVDEIVGIWVTLFFLPITPWVLTLGFLFFRVLDVLKPYPARQLEALHGGWGIMLDDLAAGIYANLLLRVLLRHWPNL